MAFSRSFCVDTNFGFSPHKNRVLHKTLSRPYQIPLRPSFGSRPEVGNHLKAIYSQNDKQHKRIPWAKCRISNVGSRWYITAVITVLQKSYTFQQPPIVCCTRPLMVLNLLSYQRHGAAPRTQRKTHFRAAVQFIALKHKHECCRYKYVRCGGTAGQLPWVHRPQPRYVLKFRNILLNVWWLKWLLPGLTLWPWKWAFK